MLTRLKNWWLTRMYIAHLSAMVSNIGAMHRISPAIDTITIRVMYDNKELQGKVGVITIELEDA